MISYLVSTLPWTLGCLALSPQNPRAIQYRKVLASCFFGTLVPLIYFFIQHKVHKVAGGRLRPFFNDLGIWLSWISIYNLRIFRMGIDSL